MQVHISAELAHPQVTPPSQAGMILPAAGSANTTYLDAQNVAHASQLPIRTGAQSNRTQIPSICSHEVHSDGLIPVVLSQVPNKSYAHCSPALQLTQLTAASCAGTSAVLCVVPQQPLRNHLAPLHLQPSGQSHPPHAPSHLCGSRSPAARCKMLRTAQHSQLKPTVTPQCEAGHLPLE